MSSFALIVPLKSSVRGKSRILLPLAQRRALALAMAHDTVLAAAAAHGVDTVLVVAEDPADAAGFADLGAKVLIKAAPGLNEAIMSGAGWLAVGGWTGPVAVIPADLPFLQGTDLRDALQEASAQPSAVVADLAGTGTTVLTAVDGASLRPHFGSWSFAAHQRAGATAVPVPISSTVRWDVDTVADLGRSGSGSSLGPHSRAVLHPRWVEQRGRLSAAE